MAVAPIVRILRPLLAPGRGGRVSLRTLVAIRWFALLGQSGALLLVHLSLGYPLPIFSALGVVAASAAVNVVASLQRPRPIRLAERDAALYLGFDILQLAALLYLTGGLSNPFAVLILAPVTISATILSRNTTILLCAVTVAALTGLGLVYWPLPWPDPGLVLPATYLFGVWFALVLATVFIATYTWQVAAEAERISDALAASQLALAREQRVSAVGALAAAAAHELGSPLGTIAVVAKDLARELPVDGPLGEDVALLLGQVDRCRAILAELQQRPEREQPFARLALPVLIETAAAPYRRQGVAFAVQSEGDGPPPTAPQAPELMHGLGNLLQNAFQFAAGAVTVSVAWDAEAVWVRIADDGPGFPAAVLTRLGEPYVSGREDPDGGMGLGIFIAETLLARTGAATDAANRPEGGATVAIRWDRVTLDGLGQSTPG